MSVLVYCRKFIDLWNQFWSILILIKLNCVFCFVVKRWKPPLPQVNCHEEQKENACRMCELASNVVTNYLLLADGPLRVRVPRLEKPCSRKTISCGILETFVTVISFAWRPSSWSSRDVLLQVAVNNLLQLIWNWSRGRNFKTLYGFMKRLLYRITVIVPKDLRGPSIPGATREKRQKRDRSNRGSQIIVRLPNIVKVVHVYLKDYRQQHC